MAGMIENVWAMQNELRNKEGITGIDAMHHVLMVLLAKSFTSEQCTKLNIPQEFAFENMIKLNKKDLMDKFYNPRNSQNCIIRYLRQGDNFGYNKDSPFQIKNLSTLEYLYNRVNKIDTDELMNKLDIVGDIYEHFINREGKTMKDLGQYFTDRLLIKYLVNICEPQLQDGNVPSVWDPSAGTGGFLIEYIHQINQQGEIDWRINKNNIFGNDINKNTYSLLKQNLYYAFKEASGLSIKLNDSLIYDDDQMYDFILANPPFGIKGLKYKDMCQKVKALDINGTKGEILFLQLCMVKLNPNGKCCVVVPEGVLFNSTTMYKKTRKYLLENFNLKRVIKVGEGEFFKNTGVKTSVLYFERTGSTESVEFIQVDKINDQIVEVPLMTIEMEKIVENEYSLNMNLYKEIILDVNDDFEVFELKDICNIKNGRNIPKRDRLETGIPYYGSNGITGYTDSYLYDGKHILQGDQGSVVGSVKYVNGKFYPGNHTLVINPKSDDHNIKYIYYYIKLCLDFKDLLAGSVIPELNQTLFRRSKIPVPTLEVQNSIVEQLDNIYENEIESSKKIVDSLKMSIETIMKNTMYRDDLQEYKIKDVCDYDCFDYDKIDTGEYKYLDISCINTSDIKTLIGKDLPGRAKHHIQYNDVIVSTVRPNLKKIMLNKDNSDNIIVTNGCCCLRSKLDKINPVILKNILLGDRVTNHFVENTTGSQYPVISYGEVYNMNIRIPPIEVQQQILEKIEPKEQLIQDLEKNIVRAEQEAKDIMSILFN